MFAPDNNIKSHWDTFITIILVFTCIVTPAQLAFSFSSNENSESESENNWEIINGVIDLLFTLDIILNFNTAYIDDDFRVIVDRKQIARTYLKGWFTIDVIAVFQFKWVIP